MLTPPARSNGLIWALLGAPLGCTDADDGGEPAPQDSCVVTLWYPDADRDFFGAGDGVIQCEQPEGYVEFGGDCDDTAADIFPGAVEVCDGLDNNCDGVTDENFTVAQAAPDLDGDGYGDVNSAANICSIPTGWVGDASDCDDANPSVNPGGVESCNTIDDDCDGMVDDADSPVLGVTTWCDDADGDGFGDPENCHATCLDQPNRVADGTDCDDDAFTVNPAFREQCFNFLDDDCDAETLDYGEDCEGVGYDVAGLGGCDAAVVAGDIGLCLDGVAAARTTGETYATIQLAIDAALAGETVTVCPGTWAEALTVVQDLALVGYGDEVSSITGSGSAILSVSGCSLTVADLYFSAGNGRIGGAVSASSVNLCVARSAFEDNTTEGFGGAIFMGGAGTLILDDTDFIGNSAFLGGGAIAVEAGYQLLIGDSEFVGNTSESNGGALEIDSWTPATIWDTTFTGNRAKTSGGAIVFAGSRTGSGLSLVRVDFSSNGGDYSGGALELGSSDATETACHECAFTGNRSKAGGAINLASSGPATFSGFQSTFSANAAEELGGGLSLTGHGDQRARFEQCTFDGNSSNAGGAMASAGSGIDSVLVVVSTITANQSIYPGGGVFVSSDGTVSSVDSDWGEDDTDNSPDDLLNYSFGSGATFECYSGYCW